jgi:hypothetical protein
VDARGALGSGGELADAFVCPSESGFDRVARAALLSPRLSLSRSSRQDVTLKTFHQAAKPGHESRQHMVPNHKQKPDRHEVGRTATHEILFHPAPACLRFGRDIGSLSRLEQMESFRRTCTSAKDPPFSTLQIALWDPHSLAQLAGFRLAVKV